MMITIFNIERGKVGDLIIEDIPQLANILVLYGQIRSKKSVDRAIINYYPIFSFLLFRYNKCFTYIILRAIAIFYRSCVQQALLLLGTPPSRRHRIQRAR